VTIKLNIEGVRPPRLANQQTLSKYCRAYQSAISPPVDWYLRFSCAQYVIEPQFLRPEAGERARKIWAFRLTPVVNRPVYTFDDFGDFIEASRNFTVDLFTKNFVRGVDQYRILRGPPCQHLLYKLQPDWTWKDDQ
jgi:hypothetical protein